MEKYFVKEVDANFNWDDIKKAPINHYSWGGSDKYNAYAQLVLIKGYGFKCKLVSFESNPWANYKNDEDPVYNDSTLEAFFMFMHGKYINFETNSIGTRLQEIGECRENRKLLIKEGLGFDVKANKYSDRFEIIIDIPFEKLAKVYVAFDEHIFKKGFQFLGNFYKTGLNPSSKEEHYGMWNEIRYYKADFHRPEQFGLFIID